MPEHPCEVWYDVICKSRSRMGIVWPPFRWRYLLEWWALSFILRNPITGWRWMRGRYPNA